MPYEDSIPDLVSSCEGHLFDYIARRLAKSRCLNDFKLGLPKSRQTPNYIYYSDVNGVRAPDALKEIKATYLQDVAVLFWADEYIAEQLLQYLQQLV